MNIEGIFFKMKSPWNFHFYICFKGLCTFLLELAANKSFHFRLSNLAPTTLLESLIWKEIEEKRRAELKSSEGNLASCLEDSVLSSITFCTANVPTKVYKTTPSKFNLADFHYAVCVCVCNILFWQIMPEESPWLLSFGQCIGCSQGSCLQNQFILMA